MLNSIRISPPLRLSQSREPFDSLIESRRVSQNFPISGYNLVAGTLFRSKRFLVFGAQITAPTAWSEEGRSGDIDESPASIDLEPICGETQFDSIMAEAQKLERLAVIVWVAKWCRKCIYLKPKLEKLAAEYYPRIQFYCVDVNVVPHKLVARAGVTKMPTIQLWKDSEKRSEVIGGHKPHLVVNEVREMIEMDVDAVEKKLRVLSPTNNCTM